MSGGSSSGKGFGGGRGKGLRKGPPVMWEGPVGTEIYPEPVFQFPVQSKSEFTTTKPLRGYDNRKEDWPKCMHGDVTSQKSTKLNHALKYFFSKLFHH